MGMERFEVLLEDINRKMDLLVEGHQMLNQKIDRVEANLTRQIQENAARIDRNAVAIARNREAIEENRRAIERNREAIERNSEAIERNSERIEALERRFSRFEREVGEKVDTMTVELASHCADTSLHASASAAGLG